jgi:GntR family transcriptional regulator
VKYLQVADALREAIRSGALPPASPLPSETQLMDRYSVSRPTARAAIAALRGEGLITVLHGKGSFVRRTVDRPAHTHDRRIEAHASGYQDADTESAGWRPVDQPGRYASNATADLALSLGVAEHTPLIIFERLLANPADRRIFHRLYLPLAVLAETDLDRDADHTPGAVYAALTRAGHRLAWTDHVRARMPAADDAAALNIPDGTPMLVTRRTTTDADTGRALAVEETRANAEDAQLAYRLDAPQLAPAEPARRTRPRRQR